MQPPTAPNGYRKTSTSITFASETCGLLTLRADGERIFVDRHNSIEIWKNGKFDDEGLTLFANKYDESESMILWIRDEVVKFASLQIGVV